MTATSWLFSYSLLIVAASLAGGALPTIVRMTHTRTQLLMSFVGGFMLGVGLLHLLPHAVVETGSLDAASVSALAGLLVMFFLMRLFHFHEHAPQEAIHVPPLASSSGGQKGVEVGAPSAKPLSAERDTHAATQINHPAEHTTPATDSSPRGEDHPHPHHAVHRLSWAGVGIGMVLHSLIDGVALAAALAPHQTGEAAHGIVGAAVFLAIVLHKPLDAMSITLVMSAGGANLRTTRVVNLLFAWVCPLGAWVFYLGANSATSLESSIIGGALGFSAGVFLCIALSDLLPELQFHAHDKLKLSLALLAGVALAYLIGVFEPDHAHQHDLDHRGPIHQHEPLSHDHTAAESNRPPQHAHDHDSEPSHNEEQTHRHGLQHE